MPALANLNAPPMNSAGAPFVLRVRVSIQSGVTPAALDAAINAFITAQEALAPTYFWPIPHIVAAGGVLSSPITYAVWIPPP